MNLEGFEIRRLVLATVNRAGGCQHHALYLGVTNGFHQRDRPADVYEVIAAWEQGRLGHADLGCQVENAIHILQQLPKQRLFVDVTLCKLDFG